jgi:hypothetical protein
MDATLQATINSSGAADLGQNGYVILTSVTRDQRGRLSVTRQLGGGGMPETSRVGTMGNPNVVLPNSGVPLRGHTLYVAEIFVRFVPVTPIGNLIGRALPSNLYDVAYF